MAVSWDEFDEFNPLIDKYMLPSGEGQTMASQAVTAVNKLIYKWYNDGDVFDNTHFLEGWANDLSSYANWLYKNVPESEISLDMIYTASSDSDYEDLLIDLATCVLNEDVLDRLEKEQKTGSIYKCNGPFEFREFWEEDDYWN